VPVAIPVGVVPLQAAKRSSPPNRDMPDLADHGGGGDRADPEDLGHVLLGEGTHRGLSRSGPRLACLLPNCCFLSETSRMLEIYRALVARGAGVRIATHGGTYEWVLRDAGVPYDLVGPRMSGGRCAEFVQSVPGIGAPDQSMWSDSELRAHVQPRWHISCSSTCALPSPAGR